MCVVRVRARTTLEVSATPENVFIRYIVRATRFGETNNSK